MGLVLQKRLEKLFFNTLNKPMEERDILNDDLKTPYLNGGLFYTYDNDKPKKEISFPEHFFAGLYKNLNEYNFTTDESTPDFEQVAVATICPAASIIAKKYGATVLSTSQDEGQTASVRRSA